ncbi:MAG: S46 family peptidase [Planctomycetia bacterium]|nr:S46 family peptidase [Planctomycetia bacterium]
MKRIGFLVVMILGGVEVRADEGMWLLNAPPREVLQKRHGFDLSDEFITRAMKGSVRLNNGGSGGFVSAEGLIVTNHHVGADLIQKVSPPDRDLLREGFLARTKEEELKCPDLEINVLQKIIDVTGEVQAAVKPGMSGVVAAAARRAVISKIEKESLERTKLRSDVVTLYQGGVYHLYLYKKYTDVRLVFAPEKDIASFGGDVDNFEYPRFNLDVSFFRAYDDGKPVRPDHFFRWSETGPAENDLVIVTGHPGVTNRLDTLAQLEHRRDFTLPYLLAHARQLESLLIQFSARGAAEARMAAKDLARIANRRKVYAGQYAALLDPKILAGKDKDEKAFIEKSRDAEPWKRIAAAMKTYTPLEKRYALLERGDAFESELFVIARHLVRMRDELAKKNEVRLPEYSDARLASLRLRLFSPAPLHPELERVKLAGSLTFLAEHLGVGGLVGRILDGKSPADRAAELIGGTKLVDVAPRQKLAEAGEDPLMALARLIDTEAREVRKQFEEQVEETIKQAQTTIAAKRFAVYGTSIAPDATFTLRLAFGTVKGYDVDGLTLPYTTNLDGAFAKAEKLAFREPFDLPKRWKEGKTKLSLDTPFNFASTSDTINGNSGSPVLNRAGELVGVNFDRNRHGLVRNFVYTDVQARHISVHSLSVLESLRKLYDAHALAKELVGK